ncbi:MAG: hypothetical protein KIH65_005290 [Candidatus Uhrbacteria bacterium]|nr:hypothetical protein [Candidatus Uhrbacteria bacterium]
MRLYFWKDQSSGKKLLRILANAPLLGAAFGATYQIVCAIGAWIFHANILIGTGYHLIFWPTIFTLRIFPFTSDLFGVFAKGLCRGLPRAADITNHTQTFVCNMAFAMILNAVITVILFTLIGVLISAITTFVTSKKN